MQVRAIPLSAPSSKLSSVATFVDCLIPLGWLAGSSFPHRLIYPLLGRACARPSWGKLKFVGWESCCAGMAVRLASRLGPLCARRLLVQGDRQVRARGGKDQIRNGHIKREMVKESPRRGLGWRVSGGNGRCLFSGMTAACRRVSDVWKRPAYLETGLRSLQDSPNTETEVSWKALVIAAIAEDAEACQE
jgi:hypothetical protein